MENTLPDLRVTIAESMEALSTSLLLTRGGAALADAYCLRDGAKTLRWCAEREAPSYEEMQVERDAALEACEEAEDNARDLIDNVTYAVSKWEHGDSCPAGQALAKADDPCGCALVERRQSVLDAVA